MGWKAACIFVTEGDPGYFGTLPPHRHERAKEILKGLYPGAKWCSAGMSEFSSELVIRDQHIAVGAYDRGCIVCDWNDVPLLCDWDGAPHFVHGTRKPLVERCVSLFPQSVVLVFDLQSVCNLFAYALFDKREMIRAYSADIDHDLIFEHGNVQPEEEEHFRNSIVRDGKRYFISGTGESSFESSADAYGEELVFAMTARFLGMRLDELEDGTTDGPLVVEKFTRARKWFGLFG